MGSPTEDMTAEEYVEQNADDIKYVIRHSSDTWIRALCLAAMVQYGDVTATQVANEIDQIGEVVDND